MIRKIIPALVAFAALMMFASPAEAQEESSPRRAVGRMGIGYTNSAAPVGLRLWFAPAIGFDLGLGFKLFQTPEINTPDPADKTQAADFAVDVGLLFAVWRKPDSQSTAYVRLGALIDRKYDGTGTDAAGAAKHSNVTRTDISIMFGVEWFMKELGVPNLSLNAAAGFAAVLNSPKHTAGASDLEFGLESSTTGLGFLTSNFGFRYYFF
jgi:hypothetical protein